MYGHLFDNGKVVDLASQSDCLLKAYCCMGICTPILLVCDSFLWSIEKWLGMTFLYFLFIVYHAFQMQFSITQIKHN